MTNTQKQIEQLIHQGRFLEARTLAEESLKESNDLRIQQLYAVSLSKSGALELALSFLHPIYQKDPGNAETVGILGGVYKQLFRKTQDSTYAMLSRDVYLKNFTATSSYYTGINAATMSAISGKLREARRIADQVKNTLYRYQDVTEKSSELFWQLATLGEANLLLRDRKNAIDCYFKARKLAGTNWGWVGSVYHQLWLLNHYVPVPSEVIKVFSPPRVAAFIGHMVDHPDRVNKRFPPEIEEQVTQSIRSTIQTLNIQVGYSSIACGADIIFAECLAEAGGEVNFILPFKVEDFIKTSVEFAGDTWVDRFQELRDKHPVKFITNESYDQNDELFHFLGKVIFGEAVLRSQLQLSEPSVVTLLSEFDLQSLKGGTRDVMKLWPFPENHTNINPDQFVGSTDLPPQPIASTSKSSTQPTTTTSRHLIYLLMADFDRTSSNEVLLELVEKAGRMDGVVSFSDHEEAGILRVGSRTIQEIMDLLSMVTQSLPDSLKPLLRVSLQVVTIPSQLDATLPVSSNKHLKQAGSIHDKLTFGGIYATDSFSAVLALDPQDYVLDLVGEVETMEKEVKRVIYKLEKHE